MMIARSSSVSRWLTVAALAMVSAVLVGGSARADDKPKASTAGQITVAPIDVADEKAVFATIESANVVPARARISGTIVNLLVNEGDRVERGQVLATIGDDKLALQSGALDAQMAAAQAQAEQARTSLRRAQELFAQQAVSKARLDDARTAANVAENNLKARLAERNVVQQQVVEGKVLAPVAGRILSVPVTAGTVMMPGETVASIAEENYVLRLRVPERHARLMKVGDTVRLDRPELAAKEGDQASADDPAKASTLGKITLVYPEISDGRVVADAVVDNLGNYFVGERVRVWIAGDLRQTIVLPADYLVTRFGVDYARVQAKNGQVMDVPVQRGRTVLTKDKTEGLEILSGLQAGDVVVKP